MKFALLTFAIICSSSLFAQKEANSENTKSDYNIFYKDGTSEVIEESDPKKLEKLIFKIWSCDDIEGKCLYNDKIIDRLVVKAGYGKPSKGNKSFKTENHIFTPLNFSEVFVKPIKKAQIFTLPKLIYKGQNYDYYEGTLMANEHKDFAILTKPDSRDVVAIITTRFYIDGKVFNYKYLLENSAKMFSNPEPIKSSLKENEFKNDNFNPYEIMDKAGNLIEGKIHFLF